MPTLVVKDPVSRIGGDAHPERKPHDGSSGKPREHDVEGRRWSVKDTWDATHSFGPGAHTVTDEIADLARAENLPWLTVLDDDLDDYPSTD
jgi:hypothetical protein